MAHRKYLLIPISEIARMAGVGESTIRKRADARGIKPSLVAGVTKLYSPEDAKKLALDIQRGWKAKQLREELGWARKAS